VRLPQVSTNWQATEHHIVVTRGAVRAPFIQAIRARGGALERFHEEIGVSVMHGLSDEDAAAVAARSDVELVIRDRKMQWVAPRDLSFTPYGGIEPLGEPSEASFLDYQWGLERIEADAAWDDANRGEGALVCVLDTGADTDHPELDGKIDLSKSATFVGSSLQDAVGHGTGVAALIASNNVGTASVAPDATGPRQQSSR
jgi:subtilisin family serine protease